MFYLLWLIHEEHMSVITCCFQTFFLPVCVYLIYTLILKLLNYLVLYALIMKADLLYFLLALMITHLSCVFCFPLNTHINKSNIKQDATPSLPMKQSQWSDTELTHECKYDKVIVQIEKHRKVPRFKDPPSLYWYFLSVAFGWGDSGWMFSASSLSSLSSQVRSASSGTGGETAGGWISGAGTGAGSGSGGATSS